MAHDEAEETGSAEATERPGVAPAEVARPINKFARGEGGRLVADYPVHGGKEVRVFNTTRTGLTELVDVETLDGSVWLPGIDVARVEKV